MRDVSDLLLQIHRAEKRNLYTDAKKTIRIAFIGTNSIQYIVKAVRFLLYEKYKWNVMVYEGNYDGISKELLDDASPYYMFHPEVTILLPDSSNTDIDFYRKLWRKLPGTVLQSNFVIPPISVYGNLEMSLPESENYRIVQANLEFIRQKPRHVFFLDFEGLASRVGKDRWFDYPAYFTSKQGFRLEFLENVCALIVRQIGALYGKIKKCLVLDLDNTLWGGIVGDDGCDGIKLDPNDPIGESYRFFQQYILALKCRGVILAVCSKNEEKIAKEPFLRNPNMILKLSDISCFVANWEDKAQNLCTIAQTLNIGMDSLVFFDDSEEERDRVHSALSSVEVIEVPTDPACFAKALSDSGAFDWIQITEEDRNRVDTYQANQKRNELLKSAVSYEKYLDALEMRYSIGFLNTKCVPRFTQLINKTNQFNLRTKRYTEAQIETMLRDPQYKLIYAELSDKFNEYGLISCVILRDNFIDTWVMSCRVFKRRVEDQMWRFILEHTTGNLYGEYLPTSKNIIVKDFYPKMGFKKISEKGEYIYERL